MKKINLINFKRIFGSGIVITAAVALFILSFFVESRTKSTIGPDFYPRIVSYLLFALGTIDLCSGIKNYLFLKKAGKLIPASAEKKTAKEIFLDNLDWVSGALVLAYVISIYFLGFLVPSIIYMFLQILLYTTVKKQRWWVSLILSVVLPAIVYFLFRNYFHLMLPAGILGFLG